MFFTIFISEGKAVDCQKVLELKSHFILYCVDDNNEKYKLYIKKDIFLKYNYHFYMDYLK